ncbi:MULTISPECIES: hexameric tyrosine-coordinated heme protein [unclassified Arthrobacter]|uniref:hexameric tyrosine-coordinated heme protein n=1 Tax=unclassified Arthrobacter TaxID=235627 RepID=UPI001D14BB27|nr:MULTISPECIES: hexameric tyrosine-coordinated heme protein [unclassified Arthrobacter]MCC3300863.1 hexameric tyrosine-coordinated heme protein [Arthrobacter sp. zg-Y895]MCQ1946255.1 hexameric tyrosine-coordinated heme protein [Arthrobacter sp. zg-Y1116]MCQ1986196.1 hexameric tyrosine-coordinated heme protein [Arthrobacter sp. zg-Y844]MCQ1994065.1 hexameric tyrosine-coordinated heme protein [Arthrobacter sp. zg-Y1171]UWX81828.1 hexameric tyrosine-coordinated heme protein [Arthrobacter sp. zg-
MELVPNNSLKCATPEEGRQLAIQLALQTAFAIQPDGQAEHIIRDAYANNPDGIIAASHVVATEFATVAAANNYWR